MRKFTIEDIYEQHLMTKEINKTNDLFLCQSGFYTELIEDKNDFVSLILSLYFNRKKLLEIEITSYFNIESRLIYAYIFNKESVKLYNFYDKSVEECIALNDLYVKASIVNRLLNKIDLDRYDEYKKSIKPGKILLPYHIELWFSKKKKTFKDEIVCDNTDVFEDIKNYNIVPLSTEDKRFCELYGAFLGFEIDKFYIKKIEKNNEFSYYYEYYNPHTDMHKFLIKKDIIELIKTTQFVRI
jgi:hypothetical protein